MNRSVVVSAVVCALVGFSAGRAASDGRPYPTTERFVLSGVIFQEGGSGIAWLQEPSLTGDRAVPVRPGQSIGPYRLTRILEDRVELQGPAGTVLVPVYNAQSGSGTAVASGPPGTAGRPAPISAAAGSSDGSATVSRPVSPQATAAMSAMPPQADPAGMKALRERLAIARRQAEESRAEPARVEQRAPGQVRAPEPAARPSSGGDPNVVYPVKGQTFQGILGLK